MLFVAVFLPVVLCCCVMLSAVVWCLLLLVVVVAEPVALGACGPILEICRGWNQNRKASFYCNRKLAAQNCCADIILSNVYV